jgi:hypothetical protein
LRTLSAPAPSSNKKENNAEDRRQWICARRSRYPEHQPKDRELAHANHPGHHRSPDWRVYCSIHAFQLCAAKGTWCSLLIDKDGTIYQTASLLKQTRHVGPIRSRCYETHSCKPVDAAAIQAARKSKSARQGALAENRMEMKKAVPDRYPSNQDSIGIEIVGRAVGPKGKEVYEPVNAQQNASLKWLVKELVSTFGMSPAHVYRHPQVSRKNVTEASTAVWQ